MKTFKKFITETNIPEDPDDYYDHEGNGSGMEDAERAHLILTHMYEHVYNLKNPKIPDLNVPSRPISLPTPTFHLKDKSGNLIRKYGWDTWHAPLSAAGKTVAAISHATGSLTGLIGDRQLDNDQRGKIVSDLMEKRIMPFVESFQDDHRKLTKTLYDHSPEFKEHVEILRGHGINLDDISDTHLYDYFNGALRGHQVGAVSVLGNFMSDRSRHDQAQRYFTEENNKAVTIHNHPLGLVLSGGPRLSSTGRDDHPTTVHEPHPTNPNEMVDVTHVYKGHWRR